MHNFNIIQHTLEQLTNIVMQQEKQLTNFINKLLELVQKSNMNM